MAKAKASKWIDALVEGVGSHFWLETTDGVEREGKITGLETRTIEVNGEQVDVPIGIEVNNDSMDSIPLNRVAKLRVG